MLRKLRRSESGTRPRGAALVEYVLLLSLFTMAAVPAISNLKNDEKTALRSTSAKIGGSPVPTDVAPDFARHHDAPPDHHAAPAHHPAAQHPAERPSARQHHRRSRHVPQLQPRRSGGPRGRPDRHQIMDECQWGDVAERGPRSRHRERRVEVDHVRLEDALLQRHRQPGRHRVGLLQRLRQHRHGLGGRHRDGELPGRNQLDVAPQRDFQDDQCRRQRDRAHHDQHQVRFQRRLECDQQLHHVIDWLQLQQEQQLQADVDHAGYARPSRG